MKKMRIASVILSAVLIIGSILPVSAKEEARTGQTGPVTSKETEDVSEDVVRNQIFTSFSDMQKKTHNTDPNMWSVRYLTEVEQYYWNFSRTGEQEKKELTYNLVSSAYQNLEMFLDNGYLLDYWELKEICEDYRKRKDEKALEEGGQTGQADAYYLILMDCLSNPYLLNKPKANVTATTYNGRDYSAVFDAEYYYENNPDLQKTIGNNPAELLRDFVEKGIAKGRRGNREFDIKTYVRMTDDAILLQQAGLAASGVEPPLCKYSYSFANYYGKYLGHYDYSKLYQEPAGDAEEDVQW